MVIRMWGGCLTIRRRSDWGVSPVRTSTSRRGSGAPCSLATRRMPANGARRLRSTSLFSAFSGDTYSSRTPSSWSSLSRLTSRYSSSMPHRKAASVLPDPVGDRISVCSPRWMAGQPSTWGGVGSPNISPNQPFTAGKKASNTSDMQFPVSTYPHPSALH